MPWVITTWINIEIERGIVLCLCAPAFGIAPPSWNILIFEHFQIIFLTSFEDVSWSIEHVDRK
jgi:hypothetical protein